MLDDAELEAIEARCDAASPEPWKSFIEDRDHWSGDDFIRVSDRDEEPDMYVSRATAEAYGPRLDKTSISSRRRGRTSRGSWRRSAGSGPRLDEYLTKHAPPAA
jgi:hypothetical protein